MLTASSELAEAVIFFDKGLASREMLLSEFEAILDSVVPMVEFANSTAHAVYIRINSKIDIAAAVFFSNILNEKLLQHNKRFDFFRCRWTG